jgi:hypothetical protein
MLRRFVIERDIPAIGDASDADIRGACRTSNATLANLAPGVQWVQSFVTADKIYCVYLAEEEAGIWEHAKQSGIPATRVSEVKRVIDPTSANG